MYSKMTLEQLQSKKETLEPRKNQLLDLQEKGTITDKQTAELEGILEEFENLQDAIDTALLNGEDNKTPEVPKYTPKKGTENMVHLRLLKGKRFDSATGIEISKPYIQMFTHAEYQLVLEHHKNVGLTIVEELYNPFKK